MLEVANESHWASEEAIVETPDVSSVSIQPPMNQIPSVRACLPFPEMGVDFDEIEEILEAIEE